MPVRRFRWVYCQIETLRRCFPASIRRTLDELPETLDGTYEQTLRGIDKQKRDYAYRLFQCLVVSKRPLRVKELAELFAIQPNTETLPTFDANLRPENPEEFILSACSTLVAVVQDKVQDEDNFLLEYQDLFPSLYRRDHQNLHQDEKIVQFSHFSVREYLISDRIAISEHVPRFHILPRPAHALLARACLSVLLYDRIVGDEDPIPPLVSYAAQYWVDHAHFEDVSLDIHHGVKLLFDRDKPYFVAWLRVYDIETPFLFPRDPFASLGGRLIKPSQSYPDPLYYAALCGFPDIAAHLLDAHPQDVNTRGGRYKTPLHAALENGHLSVAILLLERGANIGLRDSQGRTELHIVSYHGYADIISLLLDRGADPNPETNNRETPLYLASKYGRLDAARLLLEHSADLNHQNAMGFTPLRAALHEGHIDIVRLLLDYGSDAKSPNRGKSPLHDVLQAGYYSDTSVSALPPYTNPAFLGNRLDIIMLLLEHGADANYPDNNGETPLHFASQWGYIDIVRLLLDRGADASYPDNYGGTPLHIASQRGFIDIVRLLLHHGADANHPDSFGFTPLYDALKAGHDKIIQLLLDLPDSDGWTLLHAASHDGHDDIVRSLLNHGVDANRPDSDGWTVLHTASQEGHVKIVRLLLDHGADANRLDDDGWSQLHAASQEGHGTVVQLLLDHGAAADHPDRDGWTPLHAASQEGHNDIVRSLLDHGAAPNHQDNRGLTPLHSASQEGHNDIVRILLDHGAAPNHQDNRGKTPLHVAWKKSNGHHTSPCLLLRSDPGTNCPGSESSDGRTLLRRVSKSGHNNIVRLLLKHGADANQPDSDGLTPLHLALQAGTATTSTSYYSVMAQR